MGTLFSPLFVFFLNQKKNLKRAGLAYTWMKKVVNTETRWKPKPSHEGEGPVLLSDEGSQRGLLSRASGHRPPPPSWKAKRAFSGEVSG